ncbi:MAG: DUF2917 domain-containing protein [Burkholderiales bacterium]|jgi:hypothetical protein|nr:DUF2917 domain-containing protein [Burkholderiales bacterium]
MIPNDFSLVGDAPVIRDTVIVPRGGFLRIDDASGAEIHVHGGLVWLTQHHDRKDRFLEAGDRFAIDRDGRTIAQAFAEATVTLLSPANKLALRFEVVPAPVRAMHAEVASDPAPGLPTHAGAYGFVALVATVAAAVGDSLARGWFVLTRLVSPKADLPGGRHG